MESGSGAMEWHIGVKFWSGLEGSQIFSSLPALLSL